MSKKNNVSDEDRELFRRTVQGVRPLHARNHRKKKLITPVSDGKSALDRHSDQRISVASTPVGAMDPAVSLNPGFCREFDGVRKDQNGGRDQKSPEWLTDMSLSSDLSELVGVETPLHFQRCGISKKRLNELKNGQYRVEAILDLHGRTPDAAETAMTDFILAQSTLERRHVLIIHGKGGRHGEAPVIKNLVNRWLPQYPQVLAFHSALAKDGGTGALYVLLRKKR